MWSRVSANRSLFLRTEFEPNIFINDWDVAKNPKSNVAAAAILNLGKSGIIGYSSPDMVNVDHNTKFKASIFINDRDMAK